MRRLKTGFAAALALLALLLPASALAQTRALLVACSEFVTQPDLGNASSGNLHIIGSALVGAEPRPAVLSVEDGTIGTPQALGAALQDAFGEADENDLSILYLCTHGVLSSADDGQVYLLLGDGEAETPVGARELFSLVSGIQGEKLLILDACYSGALIGRGLPVKQPKESEQAVLTPFLTDPSIHVLTSASGSESSWYFDSESLSTGALSYFASALSTGLGLYGFPEADLSGDGNVTLEELHRYLSVAVPSSTSQLLSSRAQEITLPTTKEPVLSRPLTGFSYGSSLLDASDPTLEFSFTAAQETAVQYRLVDSSDGRWNWADAQTFMDEGDGEDGLLTPGRKTRALTLPVIGASDSGHLMLQVFSVKGGELILCSERLIAVQSTEDAAALSVTSRGSLQSGRGELPIRVELAVPAELTVSVFDGEGRLIRRLAASQLTRPTPDNATHLYWDGRDAQGNAVPEGPYTIAAEAIVGLSRQKATCEVQVTRERDLACEMDAGF